VGKGQICQAGAEALAVIVGLLALFIALPKYVDSVGFWRVALYQVSSHVYWSEAQKEAH